MDGREAPNFLKVKVGNPGVGIRQQVELSESNSSFKVGIHLSESDNSKLSCRNPTAHSRWGIQLSDCRNPTIKSSAVEIRQLIQGGESSCRNPTTKNSAVGIRQLIQGGNPAVGIRHLKVQLSESDSSFKVGNSAVGIRQLMQGENPTELWVVGIRHYIPHVACAVGTRQLSFELSESDSHANTSIILRQNLEGSKSDRSRIFRQHGPFIFRQPDLLSIYDGHEKLWNPGA